MLLLILYLASIFCWFVISNLVIVLLTALAAVAAALLLEHGFFYSQHFFNLQKVIHQT
jgi:hypothetical protein